MAFLHQPRRHETAFSFLGPVWEQSFLKTTVFKILYYTLVMTNTIMYIILQYLRILQYSSKTAEKLCSQTPPYPLTLQGKERPSEWLFLHQRLRGWQLALARTWVPPQAINTTYFHGANGTMRRAFPSRTIPAQPPQPNPIQSNPQRATIPAPPPRRGEGPGTGDHMTSSSWAPPRWPRAAPRWRRCCFIPSGPNMRPGRSPAPAPHSDSATGYRRRSWQ
jgi:hypothetical protein